MKYGKPYIKTRYRRIFTGNTGYSGTGITCPNMYALFKRRAKSITRETRRLPRQRRWRRNWIQSIDIIIAAECCSHSTLNIIAIPSIQWWSATSTTTTNWKPVNNVGNDCIVRMGGVRAIKVRARPHVWAHTRASRHTDLFVESTSTIIRQSFERSVYVCVR